MARANKVYLFGLEEHGLTHRDLPRLRDRTVHVYVAFRHIKEASLFAMPPRERKRKIEGWYRSLDARVRQWWPGPPPRRVGSARKPLALQGVVPGGQIGQVLRCPHLDHVRIDRIEGMRPPRRRQNRDLRFFAVRAIFAIQVEGQRSGMQTYEDRISLVKASSPQHAQKRLARRFRSYGSPYLNPEGEMVRWQFERVVDVYETYERAIDPAGTEVFSELRYRKMKPEYEWHPLRERLRPRRR